MEYILVLGLIVCIALTFWPRKKEPVREAIAVLLLQGYCLEIDGWHLYRRRDQFVLIRFNSENRLTHEFVFETAELAADAIARRTFV